jgi:hypothetical protein
VHYVVDTTGAVIPATATVRRATEEELGKAVLDAVVRSRFYPARRNGIAVAQLDTAVWSFRRPATSGASLQRGAPPMTAGC